MPHDNSYRVSFTFAMILHLVLLIFLLVKFTAAKSSIALMAPGDVINATAINEREFAQQISKMAAIPKVEPKPQLEKLPANELPLAPEVKPEVKSQSSSESVEKIPEKTSTAKDEKLQKLLQDDLLKEQAKEIAELKREKQQRKKVALQKKQQATQRELRKALHQQILAEQQQLASEQASVQGRQLQGEVDKYKYLIMQAISSQWIVPEGVSNGAVCKLLINVAPGGVVLDVQLLSSSGNLALDRSAQAAVFKASPLPVPEDAALFDKVRTIKLTVKPEGIIGN